MVFAIHSYESAMGVPVSPILNLPSHLPAHPIPQGHPSAPALSALTHAWNLGWRSISHMVIHMFQCYSLKSSHPCLPPQSPEVCSIHLCLFCCLAYRVILTIWAPYYPASGYQGRVACQVHVLFHLHTAEPPLSHLALLLLFKGKYWPWGEQRAKYFKEEYLLAKDNFISPKPSAYHPFLSHMDLHCDTDQDSQDMILKTGHESCCPR